MGGQEKEVETADVDADGENSQTANEDVVDEATVGQSPAAVAVDPRHVVLAQERPMLWQGMYPKESLDRRKFTCAVIWLHELGSTEIAWQQRLHALLPESLGPVKWLWPRAEMHNVTAQAGVKMTSWFDITELPVQSVVGVPDRQRHEDSAEEMNRSVRRIHKVVKNLEDSGIPSSKIAIGGFQQGAALAVHAALRYKKTLAACVALHAWIPVAADLKKLATEDGRSVEILWCQGTKDAVVSVEAQDEGATMLQNLGVKVTNQRGVRGHDVGSEDLKLAMTWLADRLQYVPKDDSESGEAETEQQPEAEQQTENVQ